MKDRRIVGIPTRDTQRLVERGPRNKDGSAPVVKQTVRQFLDAVASSWPNRRFFPTQRRTIRITTADGLIHAVKKRVAGAVHVLRVGPGGSIGKYGSRQRRGRNTKNDGREQQPNDSITHFKMIVARRS